MPAIVNVALLGSVSSTLACLEAFIESGVTVTGVLGVDESRGEAISDYRSLRETATGAGIPFLSFVRVRDPEVTEFLQAHKPDMLWVIGISQLVPDELIRLAPQGGIGFHPTMLPEGRGRAPVAWTILKNARAAVSLFYLTEEADAGDLIAQREVPVLPNDYSEDLIARTNVYLKSVIRDLAPRIIAGDVPRTPQDHSRATFYEKRTAADGLIDWSQPTDQVYRLIRAAGRPYPGAFTYVAGAKLTIWRGRPVDSDGSDGPELSAPGTIVEVGASGAITIATGDGAMIATEIEFDGAGPITAGDRCSNGE